jgi:NAD(P)-dependent dehydrogenase (short-subunit alcohol dehydrogenase family)
MNVSNAQFYKVDCDLQSFESVRASIEVINELCPEGLNVLCNNAGIMAFRDEPTIDGYDVQMQTNHLSHFLLTKLLMPKLEEAAEKYGEARVVNHSSVARNQQKELKSEYLERRGGKLGGDGASMFFSGARWVRYSQTKLANAAFTACLHEKFQKSNSKLKAMVAHPGLAESDLQSSTVKDGGMGSFFTRYLMKLGQSEKDGSLGLLRCIADPKINSGVIVGPGLRGLKGKAKAFPLEKFYDNDNTKSLLWSKSCEAISEEFNI